MLQANQRIGLVFFPAFDWAIDPSHPEREERLLYTRDQIVEEGLLDLPGVTELRPRLVTSAEVQRAHICVPDVAAQATHSHRIAAGGCIVAADAVLERRVERSFALLRPPGHHAMRIVHGCRGFCNINNEAIMIEHIRQKYGGQLKIAVVDTDAHHADGSQDIYYNDPNVLHLCIHQDGRTLYPGTGDLNELGGPGAFGLTLNVPLPPGSGDRELLYVIEQLALPVLADFKPDILINGAGQDNHYSDPLTDMRVTAGGYARLTELLNPDIVVLEGGYSIEGALPYVNLGIILALAGLDYSEVREPDWQPALNDDNRPVHPAVREAVEYLLEIWRQRADIDLNRLFGKGPFFERNRRIYYDTDQIEEEQSEEIRRCPACSGYRVIHSRASKGYGPERRIAAVLIPRHACAECRGAAAETFARLNPGAALQYVYLQDPEQDRFEIKSRADKK